MWYTGYRLEQDWRLSGSISYNSGEIMLQGKRSSFFSSNLSVTKTIDKGKKANFTFTVSNPFTEKRVLSNEITDAGFSQYQRNTFIIRRFNLSFHYRFGKLKQDIARKKRGIKNDDLKGTGQ
jgi:hypothetical protein